MRLHQSMNDSTVMGDGTDARYLMHAVGPMIMPRYCHFWVASRVNDMVDKRDGMDELMAALANLSGELRSDWIETVQKNTESAHFSPA